MEQLYVFGTGNAAVIHYYNTCFAIRNEDRMNISWWTPAAATVFCRFLTK